MQFQVFGNGTIGGHHRFLSVEPLPLTYPNIPSANLEFSTVVVDKDFKEFFTQQDRLLALPLCRHFLTTNASPSSDFCVHSTTS